MQPIQFDNRINYSIDNIERSIAADNPISKKYTVKQKKNLYQQKLKMLDNYPELKKIINIKYIHDYPIEGIENWGRIGIIPPEFIISDDRIKDMCRYQLWTNFVSRTTNKREWRFTRCPGIETASACPYFTPPAKKVRELFGKSDIFIIMQTKLFTDYGGVQWEFKTITRFREDVQKALGKRAVMQTFGAGPCQICYPKGCLENGKCRHKKLQVPSLEAMGIPVGQLCRDMALLTGDKSWELKWIKHWGLPTMTLKKWKVNFGLAVKLNGVKKV
jgi:hypothetical protein